MSQVLRLFLSAMALGLLSAGYFLPQELAAVVHTGWSTDSLRVNQHILPDIGFHLLITSGRCVTIILEGLVCAACMTLGASLTRSRLWNDLLVIAASVPPLVWVPLSLATYGMGDWRALDAPAAVFVGAMTAPAWALAARSAPPAPIEMMRTLNVAESYIWTRVRVPWSLKATAPQLGLTVALVFGVCVIFEYLASIEGVGIVLKLETPSLELGDIVGLTAASAGAVLVIQLLVRGAVSSLAALL